MKKKSQSFSLDFKMPHLFREDLESMENTVKDLSPQECKFETKDFEYKTIQEIPNNIDPVNDFHIQVYSPYISLDLKKNNARIYANDDNIKTIGVVKKISDIISKRERKTLRLLSDLAIWIAPGLFIYPISILIALFKKGIGEINLYKLLLFSSISLISAIWWIVSYRSSLYCFSIIEFSYRKDKTNFLTKNRDRIIVEIILVIVSVVLTLFFQKLFK